MKVGLISDTHGVLDPRVHEAMAGVDAIVHAGDVGTDAVLYELETIATVTAVLGNCDYGIPGFDLSLMAKTTIGGVRVLVIHDIHDLGEVPDDVDVVVCGHSHRPSIQQVGRVLVVNPGSASQRRLMPSRSVGLLEITGSGDLNARIVLLDDKAPQSGS